MVTGSIIAWLTSTDTTPPEQTFTVGDVTYEWTEGTFVTSPVVPGQNLIGTPYNLVNTSNVTSELRLLITITYPVSGTPTDATHLVNYTLNSNWGTEPDADGFYYYRAVSPVDGKYPIAANTNIDVITGLILDGSLVGNDFSGVIFTVTMTFQGQTK